MGAVAVRKSIPKKHARWQKSNGIEKRICLFGLSHLWSLAIAPASSSGRTCDTDRVQPLGKLEVPNQNVRALHFRKSLYPIFLLGTSISKSLLFCWSKNDVLQLNGNNCLHFAMRVGGRHPTDTPQPGCRSLSVIYSVNYVKLPIPRPIVG